MTVMIDETQDARAPAGSTAPTATATSRSRTCRSASSARPAEDRVPASRSAAPSSTWRARRRCCRTQSALRSPVAGLMPCSPSQQPNASRCAVAFRNCCPILPCAPRSSRSCAPLPIARCTCRRSWPRGPRQPDGDQPGRRGAAGPAERRTSQFPRRWRRTDVAGHGKRPRFRLDRLRHLHRRDPARAVSDGRERQAAVRAPRRREARLGRCHSAGRCMQLRRRDAPLDAILRNLTIPTVIFAGVDAPAR